MREFFVISKHRMVSHHLPKLKISMESLNNEQIWLYFPNAGADKSQIILELDMVFSHLAEAMVQADPEQIDVYSIYHLVEHTGYHLGQIIDRAQRLSGVSFQFVQHGINEKVLRNQVQEEMERSL